MCDQRCKLVANVIKRIKSGVYEMNKKRIAHYQQTIHRSKRQQQGLTLIEVLVSVVVLALGVSALLMTQLRAVSGVRESEGQTIVAQATQNLVEGMLSNPVLSAGTDGWTTKSYTHYDLANAATNCNNDLTTNIGKNVLAAHQLCRFKKELTDNLKNATWAYHMCQDDSGKEPEVAANYSVNFHCSGTGSTVVKVVWQINHENNQNNDGNQSITQDRAIYTYQTYVTN